MRTATSTHLHTHNACAHDCQNKKKVPNRNRLSLGHWKSRRQQQQKRRYIWEERTHLRETDWVQMSSHERVRGEVIRSGSVQSVDLNHASARSGCVVLTPRQRTHHTPDRSCTPPAPISIQSGGIYLGQFLFRMRASPVPPPVCDLWHNAHNEPSCMERGDRLSATMRARSMLNNRKVKIIEIGPQHSATRCVY